jgi:hypothetical protein
VRLFFRPSAGALKQIENNRFFLNARTLVPEIAYCIHATLQADTHGLGTDRAMPVSLSVRVASRSRSRMVARSRLMDFLSRKS